MPARGFCKEIAPRNPLSLFSLSGKVEDMDLSDHAADQLRTIRSLLERATVYRTISVPAAAAGGLVALAAGWFTRSAGPGQWLLVWHGVLVLVAALNTAMLAAQSRREGRPLLGSGLRLAVRGLVPPLLAGGVLGSLCAWSLALEWCAALWILFYGLALLATQEFAPRSLVWLGRAFFAAGLGSVALCLSLCKHPSAAPGSILMAATFGLFHLAYAAAVTVAARRSPPET